MSVRDLSYRILGVNVGVHCSVPELRSLVEAHWRGVAVDDSNVGKSTADLDSADLASTNLFYTVARSATGSAISISRPGQETIWAVDEGEFLYQLEVDATIAVQLIRKDLYFLHAAVAEVAGHAYLLVAESGGGKSTTLWGMLHHGWRYLSDELAPIDVSTLCVQAYPRALCLKRRPTSYVLPGATVETQRTLHVPVTDLPCVSDRESCPLVAAYFVKYCPEADAPSVRVISSGEAGARLYANSLNQLAHANAGLDAAVRIAKSISSFALGSADLAATCRLLAAHATQTLK